ncbi:hypothetical protein GCM10008164_47780 [Achromobacter xylosoxidans]|nr:hypothetical protein GCM10008164_47780 [Achromobacter xylosoxidans]
MVSHSVLRRQRGASWAPRFRLFTGQAETVRPVEKAGYCGRAADMAFSCEQVFSLSAALNVANWPLVVV